MLGIGGDTCLGLLRALESLLRDLDCAEGLASRFQIAGAHAAAREQGFNAVYAPAVAFSVVFDERTSIRWHAAMAPLTADAIGARQQLAVDDNAAATACSYNHTKHRLGVTRETVAGF